MKDQQVDTVVPGDKWAFDESVTDAFDDMFARSIPGYEAMRAAVFSLGARFVQLNTDIVDLGAARGGALAPFVDKFGAHNRFHGVEVSSPMASSFRERFAGFIKTRVVHLHEADLRTFFPPVAASLTLAVMTLQFTPIEYRHAIMQHVFDTTLPGGAFILAEKVLGRDDATNRMLVETHHALKRANGYSDDAIERKRLALEGVLVPVTAAWNEELLERAGFAHVDCFWRSLNFAAWIAIKAGGARR